MSQVVFTAALTGAAAHPDGGRLLDALGLERPARLLADHTTCYPPQEPGAVLEPLYPDRLAEDFLALSLPGHGQSGHPTAPWAAHTLGVLVARAADGSPPAHLARLLTFLASAAAPHRWPHAARHLEDLLRADAALAVAAGGAALTALAAVDLDPAVLEAVDAYVPRRGQVDLDAGIAALTRRLTDIRLAAGDDPAEHARLYQDLGFRMLRAGHAEEAADVTERAVALLRRLSAADPVAHEPALATALAHLSERAFAAARTEASRRAAEEAVALFRRLSAADPAAYEPGLAVSLFNLGQGMAEARRPEEALAATQWAMGIFRRLADTDPATYAPGLAMTLANEAVFAWKLRRWADALTAAERAVVITRGLVAAGPGASASELNRSVAVDESDLATALANLGYLQWGARRRADSLASLREAAGIKRRLAQINPTAHEPPYAGVLSLLGAGLGRCGLHEEALAVTGEVVDIYRRLAAQHPDRFGEMLAKAVEEHEGARDRASGRPPEGGRTWTFSDHYVTLLNQDEVWQDGQDRRFRLADMDAGYCGNVLRFLLLQADGVFATLVDGLGVSPESLGRRDGEDAAAWLLREQLVVALHRRSEGKPARPELCHCGYAIRPDWNHDHCYPGIIVD